MVEFKFTVKLHTDAPQHPIIGHHKNQSVVLLEALFHTTTIMKGTDWFKYEEKCVFNILLIICETVILNCKIFMNPCYRIGTNTFCNIKLIKNFTSDSVQSP